MDATDSETEQLLQDRPDSPGALLRRAREERGMSIGDVAELTRVAQRQLEAIERSDFGALPGTPYAVGFARAYARAVGADEVAVARGVREELGVMEAAQRHEMFEPVDPARVPPRRLAWVAAGIAVILAIAYAVWRTQFFAASTDQEIAELANRASEPAAAVATGPVAAPAPSAPAGPVVLTARTDVWLRIYDQAGERLFEKEMAQGESYTVPPQANNPMILTGRPDALTVTVGGKPVAPLGPPDKTIVDVPVSASALLARPAAAPASSSTTASAGPARSASPAPPASAPASAPVAVEQATPTADGELGSPAPAPSAD